MKEPLMSFTDFLTEARSHPDLNPKVSMMARIEPYRKAGYYITFTGINKVGINPVNEFDTPIGVYCYPVKEMWKFIARNDVPFASERPFVSIIRKKNGKMLDYKATDADVKRCHKILVKKYGISTDLKTACMFGRGYSVAKDAFTRIWVMSRNAARKAVGEDEKEYKVDDGRRTTAKWSSIMRKDLGYIGAQDLKGDGIIHPNEPIQAVFFSSDAFEIVGTFDNRRYRDDALFADGKESGKAEGWKASPMDLAAEAFGKCCGGKNAVPKMFVPYGVGDASKFKVEGNGTSYVLKNFGFRNAHAEVRSGKMRLEGCVFMGYTDVSGMELVGCSFGNMDYTKASRCVLRDCSFAVGTLGNVRDVRVGVVNNGCVLNPAECVIYVKNGSASQNFNPKAFPIAIDCGVLVRRNPDFRKFAGNRKMFFKLLEETIDREITFAKSHPKADTTKDVMDILCNAVVEKNGDFDVKSKATDWLQECGKLGKGFDDDRNVFVPYGMNVSKMEAKRDANTLVLKNFGFFNLEFKPKAGCDVVFENCVVRRPRGLEGVTLRRCVLLDVKGGMLKNSEMLGCSIVEDDIFSLPETSEAIGGNGNKVDVKGTEIYVGDWRREEAFDKSTCHVRLTYPDLVKALPTLKQHASDFEKFVKATVGAIEEHGERLMTQGMEFPYDTKTFLDMLSATANVKPEKQGDEFARVADALRQCGKLKLEAEDMFVPHGVAGKKNVKIVESDDGSAVTVMNCGFESIRLSVDSGKQVNFVNCVMVCANGTRIEDAGFLECKFIEPQYATLRDCNFIKCSCAISSLGTLQDLAYDNPFDKGDFDVKDFDMYVGNWGMKKPLFDPASCGIHLTYRELMKAQPALDDYTSDFGEFVGGIESEWRERLEYGEDYSKTTEEFMEVISRIKESEL